YMLRPSRNSPNLCGEKKHLQARKGLCRFVSPAETNRSFSYTLETAHSTTSAISSEISTATGQSMVCNHRPWMVYIAFSLPLRRRLRAASPKSGECSRVDHIF